MADDPDIKAYPFQFDPSQFANPYTQWNKQALPFMGRYGGTPTDAHGNPIGSYQDAQKAQAAAPPAAPPKGMTLNSSPQSNIPQYFYNPGGMIPTGQNTGLDHPQYIPASYQVNPAYVMSQQGMGQQQAAPPAAPAAPAGPDMNAAYLQALANPGKVTTPGATVAQSAPPSASSGVLQQFLQNWKPGAIPPGLTIRSLFPDALRGMV